MKRQVMIGILLAALLLLSGCGKRPSSSALPLHTQPGSASESTQRPTQPKGTGEPTETQPQTEAPETEPQPSVETRNGYAVCPTCGAIYSADGSCWHCSGGGELGERCPDCGGYTGITELAHTSCNYCQAMLCSLVLQEGQRYEDVHCADCGACQLETGLVSKLMGGEYDCESCRFQGTVAFTQEDWEKLTHYEYGKYTICPVCTAVYAKDSHCWNCAEEWAGIGVICGSCGGGLGITDVRHTVCDYCGADLCPLVDGGEAYERVHCRACGICQLYRGINWYGFCNDCAN